jgi:hypothetical protein
MWCWSPGTPATATPSLALDGLLDKVLTLDLPFTAPVDTSYALALTGPAAARVPGAGRPRPLERHYP